MTDIKDIKERVRQGKYRISFTHTEKLRQREIEIRELEEALAYEPSPEEWESDWKTRR